LVFYTWLALLDCLTSLVCFFIFKLCIQIYLFIFMCVNMYSYYTPTIIRFVASISHSLNPIPIEGFSSNLAEMFTSTRGCAEPMLPMCQLKVKVTIKGQISSNQILDIMSCPLCKSYTNWKVFFNLGSNVHLNKGMCRTHVTLLPA